MGAQRGAEVVTSALFIYALAAVAAWQASATGVDDARAPRRDPVSLAAQGVVTPALEPAAAQDSPFQAPAHRLVRLPASDAPLVVAPSVMVIETTDLAALDAQIEPVAPLAASPGPAWGVNLCVHMKGDTAQAMCRDHVLDPKGEQLHDLLAEIRGHDVDVEREMATWMRPQAGQGGARRHSVQFEFDSHRDATRFCKSLHRADVYCTVVNNDGFERTPS